MFKKNDISWLFSFLNPALTWQLLTSRQLWWHLSCPFSFSERFLWFWRAFAIAALRHLSWILSSLAPVPLVSLSLMNRALFILVFKPYKNLLFFSVAVSNTISFPIKENTIDLTYVLGIWGVGVSSPLALETLTQMVIILHLKTQGDKDEEPTPQDRDHTCPEAGTWARWVPRF